MANGKPFFGGMPTEMDVKKLMSTFPKLHAGLQISHGEIELLIGVKKDTSRYRTIVNAWRQKIFKEQNEWFGSIPGVGYKVLSPEERRDFTVEIGGGIAKKARKMVKHAITIPTEKMSDLDKRSVDTLRLYSMRLAQESANTNKAIRFELKALGHSTFDERKKALGLL